MRANWKADLMVQYIKILMLLSGKCTGSAPCTLSPPPLSGVDIEAKLAGDMVPG